MISGYESVITGPLTKHRSIQTDDAREPDKKETLGLAPWCDVQAGLIYNDYAASAAPFPQLVSVLEVVNGPIQVNPGLLTAGTGLAGEIDRARSAGILVPRFRIGFQPD